LWCSTEAETTSEPFWGLLAKSPSYFSRSPDIAAPCTMTIASNTPATLTGRGVNVEFLLALIPNDVSQSTYSTIIFVDGGKRAYGILLQKLSYSGGQFARVGVDILLEIDNNMKINSSKLPHRILSRLDIDFDPQLKESQALRFYVRQNPKIPSVISNEAAGFYFDPEKSLPPSMDVDDWFSALDSSKLRSTSLIRHYPTTDRGATFMRVRICPKIPIKFSRLSLLPTLNCC